MPWASSPLERLNEGVSCDTRPEQHSGGQEAAAAAGDRFIRGKESRRRRNDEARLAGAREGADAVFSLDPSLLEVTLALSLAVIMHHQTCHPALVLLRLPWCYACLSRRAQWHILTSSHLDPLTLNVSIDDKLETSDS